jgi:biopolymer transport protein ExbB/biopolymer transport protein TolQ
MIVEKLLRVALLGSAWVLYLMIALSVISIGAMLERAVYFMRRNVDVDELGDELLKRLEKSDHEGAAKLLDEKSPRSIEASVLAPAMMYLDANPDALEDRINSELVAARQEMERGTNLLGTLGNNAPFIGLFGTVIGVIIAFQQLSHTNGAGNMGNVMAGIAEALVATGVGLFVAIPAVVGYNIIQKRIADVEGNVTALTKRVTAHLKAVNSGWSKHGSRHVHRLASGA